MSVEDDDWATAVDIQEGLTKVEINESAKPEGDEFTTVSFNYLSSSKTILVIWRGSDQSRRSKLFAKSITPKTSNYSKRARSTTT